ncbi:type 1 glutamine amidotransferase domain-containing protein [Guyparkeria sp.]|uniref:type 1 glutamine amidotransferase domain-containing protein n=1 Tax=Guyparkeria sp. TaxID=2035736 RepID=UPI003970DE59
MAETLTGKRVALLVADGFEQVELTEPKRALEQAGATAQIVSPAGDRVKGWQHTDWGDAFDVDVPLDSASASDFHALVLPGGVMNPDALRQNEKAVNFVRGFFDQNKPVAAICHGGWTLAEADVLQGRRVTSYPSIQTDLKNAGAVWVDEEVVDDNGLITSRNPNDLPAFTAKLIEKIAAG